MLNQTGLACYLLYLHLSDSWYRSRSPIVFKTACSSPVQTSRLWKARWYFWQKSQVCSSLLYRLLSVPGNRFNNANEKIACFWLAHKCKVVTWVQITNSSHTLSKFHLHCYYAWCSALTFFDVFSCTLFTSNNIISFVILCNKTLQIFQRLQIAFVH